MVNKRMLELGSKRSTIRELFEYGKLCVEKYGKENVYDFSIGNPSVPAPECVTQVLMDILKDDPASVHGYTSAQGDINTRRAIAEELNAKYGTAYNENDFFMTCGAAASLTVTLNALCVSGEDEFIALAPYFPEYKVFCEGSGAKFVVCPAAKDFGINLAALEGIIKEHTKGVIVNSPNNPTGAVYSVEQLTALAQLLKRKSAEYGTQIFIICDEPYREIVYEGKAAHIPNIYDNTVICYSYSKSLSLPGERIGYILVPPKACEARKVYAACAGAARSLGFVCAPALFQKLITRVTGQTSDIEEYRINRDILYNGLTKLGYKCIYPAGAFYLFVAAPDGDDIAFSENAKKYNLLIVPSTDFGCPGYARLSYCVDRGMIERSLAAFEKLINENY